MGLEKTKNDKSKLEEIVYCGYWPFVRDAGELPRKQKLDSFADRGVDFQEFCKYIDILLSDTKEFQEDECEREIEIAVAARDELEKAPSSSAAEIEKANSSIFAMTEKCDKLKESQSWKLKNTKVKLVVHNNGTIQAFETKLPMIKKALQLVQKINLSHPEP